MEGMIAFEAQCTIALDSRGGGTADAPALGAGGETLESSNLSSDTALHRLVLLLDGYLTLLNFNYFRDP